MSCLRYSHPPAKRKHATAQAATIPREVLIIRHLGDMVSVNVLENARHFLQMKLRILGLDADKKTVRGRMREAVNVEDRMVRLRQFVQGQHAENGGERCAENGQFKSNRDEGGPAIEGTATDVHGISDRRRPVLKEETANST